MKQCKSWCSKIKDLSVEPILFCYSWPSVMASIAMQNLNLEKACRVNLRYDEAICDAMSVRNKSGYSEHDEQETQKIVASINGYKSIMQSVLPIVILLFLGSWSDRHARRKPCMILPLVGEIGTTVGSLISLYFFYELPVEFNCFAEAIPQGLGGGWYTMCVGVFTYVTQISTEENRTLRIGAVSVLVTISLGLGSTMSGILFNKLGFYGVFLLSIAMYMAALIYIHFRIHDDVVDKSEGAGKGFMKDFFDLSHIKETIKVAFKQGPRNRKKRICAIMLLLMVTIAPFIGENNVLYLYVRYRFGWNELDYSLYSTFDIFFHGTGVALTLFFFSKFLKLDDSMLGTISSIGRIVSGLICAFAPTVGLFYLGAMVDLLSGAPYIAMRSIMSKLVPSDELGKIYSLFSVCEALMPLIYGPMYSFIYNSTITILPGFFYLFRVIFPVPSLCVFFWLYKERKSDLKEEELKAQCLTKVNGCKNSETVEKC